MGMKGGCLCGAVRFEAEGVGTQHHVCHCRMCQRWIGGPAMAAMTESVSFEDDNTIRTYSSSDWAERGFCSRCGTSLFYRLKGNGMTFLQVGLFDDVDAFKLSGEIFFDRKPKGYDFAGEHERLSEEETLARFAAEMPS